MHKIDSKERGIGWLHPNCYMHCDCIFVESEGTKTSCACVGWRVHRNNVILVLLVSNQFLL